MNDVLSAIVPVFLVAAAGYGIRRITVLDAKTLSSLNVYLLVPALVFSVVYAQEVEWPVLGRYAIATGLVYAVMAGLLSFVAWRRGMEGLFKSAFLMTTFVNLGNYGLPLAKFGFGDAGLTLAIGVMLCGSFLQNTVGLYFAQRHHHPMRKAALNVFTFPAIYAFVLALLLKQFHRELHPALFRAIDLTGDAAIPVPLLILGIKIAETRLDIGAPVMLATGIRLALGPIVAVAVALLIGLEDLNAKIFILQMSGPVAVGMAAYSVQFDVEPRFLSSVVSWTFCLSLVTVGVTLYVLKLLPL